MQLISILRVALVVASAQAAATPSVVAHFIVGNAQSFQASDWDYNIRTAMAAGLDGFALDVAPDSTIVNQVPLAYSAAEKTGKFKVFLQFDFNSPTLWAASAIAGNITKFSNSTAQFKVNGKPLVSTFEGPSSSDLWPSIKANTSAFFAPDWTSVKQTSPQTFNVTDGALSWDIWPHGASNMTDSIDLQWENILGNKTYIMGVSPWFYTNLPQYQKNWVARSAGLWHSRWQTALALRPPMVEVVTWNDFGESHYVGPNNCTACYPPGSAAYVQNNPHDGWLKLLPTYINMLKSGNNQTGSNITEMLVYAHTPNPVSNTTGCSDGGTVSQVGSVPAGQVAVDAIDVYAVVKEPAQVTVQIGTQNQTFTAAKPGVNFFSVSLNGQTGPVTYLLSRNGIKVVGGTERPGISTNCTAYGGKINYNAITGSFP